MSLRVVSSGHLVRYPVGGHSWHPLQSLMGLRQLGHDVVFFETFGWPDSCYDPVRHDMTSDATYGTSYVQRLMDRIGMGDRWCFLAEDGRSHGLSRTDLADALRQADLYLNLSNVNWIPEVECCRRRVLVDTDPVFTQIGAFGAGGAWDSYDALFTYGENIHRSTAFPTGGARWRPTRQPVVLGAWPFTAGDEHRPLTSVMSWKNFGPRTHEGVIYGQKDVQFAPF